MRSLICLVGMVALVACDTEEPTDSNVSDTTELEDEDSTEDEDDAGTTEEEDEEETESPANGEGDPCETEEASIECEGGVRYCDNFGGETLQWGICVTDPWCELGDTETCEFDEEFGGGTGRVECILHNGEPMWEDAIDFEAGCNTPLVLSFDAAAVELVPAPAATFDIDGNGACLGTDWPTAATPWLAIDRNRDGQVDSGAELFGSGTRLRDGKRAAHGFEALAELDSNGDGRITSADAAFSDLVLWGDVDMDKRGSFAEFESLAGRRILSIDLGYQVATECDARGNCGVERASFTFIDRSGAVRTGEVIDLHLACEP